MTTRRRLLSALGGIVLTGPFGSFAQQPGKVWRMGYLHLRAGPSERDEAFFQALRVLGYVDGKNLRVEYRWTAGKTQQLAELAAELIGLNVDVMVTSSVEATQAAMQASSTVPIVMAAVADPLRAGLIKSLARPGGNVTGLSQLVAEVSGKRLELLREVVPKAMRIGVLADGTSPGDTRGRVEQLRAASRKMGVQLFVEEPKGAEDWPANFEAMKRNQVQALYVQTGPSTIDNRKLVAQLALNQRLPAIYEIQDFTNAGGLISYGYNISEMYSRATTFIHKVFQGANPAEIPVEQPTKFDLIVNMKAAKALGIEIPKSILLRADRLIE